jgi:hypothetical protein
VRIRYRRLGLDPARLMPVTGSTRATRTARGRQSESAGGDVRVRRSRWRRPSQASVTRPRGEQHPPSWRGWCGSMAERRRQRGGSTREVGPHPRPHEICTAPAGPATQLHSLLPSSHHLAPSESKRTRARSESTQHPAPLPLPWPVRCVTRCAPHHVPVDTYVPAISGRRTCSSP